MLNVLRYPVSAKRAMHRQMLVKNLQVKIQW